MKASQRASSVMSAHTSGLERDVREILGDFFDRRALGQRPHDDRQWVGPHRGKIDLEAPFYRKSQMLLGRSEPRVDACLVSTGVDPIPPDSIEPDRVQTVKAVRGPFVP